MFGGSTNKLNSIHGGAAYSPYGFRWVWGNNYAGQLGINSRKTLSAPIQADTERNWLSVKTSYYGGIGFSHTLGIKKDRTLWGWGGNSNGQLGLGTAVPVGNTFSSPVQIGTDTWSYIASGAAASAAIKRNGTLWSWGSNTSGQLGNGVVTSTSSPVQVGIGSDWSIVRMGGRFRIIGSSFGIKTNGTLFSWGYNEKGQLGIGTTAGSSFPVQVGSGITGDWLYLFTNDEHVVGMRTDRTIWSWGKNTSGQLGLGNTTNRSVPIQIGSDTWTAISCGTNHVLGIKSNGTLWAWGANGDGRLGLGDTTNRSSPLQIGTNTDWQSVSAGYYHSLATKTDGTTWTWGSNRHGNLGIDKSFRNYYPTRIGSLTGWSSVLTCGKYHTIAIRDDTSIWGWGLNGFSQVANASVVGSVVSSPVQTGSSTTGWSKVDAGESHTIVIKNNGTLWGWGSNDFGAIGVPNPGGDIIKSFPVQIGTLTGWANISCGEDHTLAIRDDGTLWSWGRNNFGQLGQGLTTTTNISSPVQIGSLTGWSSIAAGRYHSLATRTSGTLWAWGKNNNGQLGIGSTTNRSSPVQVGSGTTGDWIFVSAGEDISAGLRQRGITGRNLWTWGANFNGGLGRGFSVTYITPGIVGTVADNIWETVDCGDDHMVALKMTKTLWVWGSNRYGQLGLGDEVERSRPTQVGSDVDWAAVKAGGMHTTGVKTDGSIFTWGRNNFGQQPTGNIVLAVSSPVQVGSSLDWGTPKNRLGTISTSASTSMIRR